MCNYITFLIVALAFFNAVNARHKVLLVLVDGCRWDYPDTDSTLTGFKKLAEKGVRAEYVTPIFPSNSYPNWYTIVTGLYAESHGFVQNMMYDPIHKDFFLMGPNKTASVLHWWNHAEPIWITAEKNNLRTSLYWWDGCQVEIKGKKPTFCVPYKYVGEDWETVDADTRNAFLEALDKLKSNEVQLVQVYYESVDHKGHKYGPDSDERKEAFRSIDRLLYELQEEITKRGLEDQVNLVVVSDHGMTLVDPRTTEVINLDSVLQPSDIKYMIYQGASCMILPEDGKEVEVYNKIKNYNHPGLHVYRKEDIPDEYHLKHSYLTLPILLVADEGYFISGLDFPDKSIPGRSTLSKGGSHGYDPYKVKDMRTIFYARGPDLKKGYISPPIENVDHYNLMCHLLGIKPLSNNGSLERIEGMFTNSASYSKSISVQSMLFIVTLIITLIIT
ncbi:ectonucleotide pyrophosphatase/phosphodiesterase family member 6-like [Centruroides sculpturatus]|uniref:ectonucleotide pyrophosphatase/phosphodiesterase family member 6-like n=1 Tax=Centruroides sculpturatus TaxID=218467 RepID=UPI000C6E0311|nr:ectonucleotide pyrophosphatase/phosphodiesterase family member 6-like [Centruroides sculpturatus]